MMNHIGTKELETKRLLLRRFQESDDKAMYQNWGSDDEVTTYLSWPTHSSIEVSREILGKWVSEYCSLKTYNWAIVLKEESPEPIGGISVVRMNEDIAMAEVGYCIGSRWWHQGITTAALQSVIGYLIHEAGFNRIQARHDVRNPNSGAVMKKAGMRYEGTLRQASKSNLGLYDASIWAVLADDLRQISG